MFNYLSRDVVRLSATRGFSNITGSVVNTYATPATIRAIFLKREQRWSFDREGLVDLGDAYVIVKINQDLQIGDRFQIDGETYEITPESKNVIIRKIGDVEVYKYAPMFKISGSQT
jgi:uncharacterized protein (UPF0128 family)